jgi:large subunit ribosomal protein L19
LRAAHCLSILPQGWFNMADPTEAVQAPTNPNIPDLRPGDTVSVHVRITEGGRERVQEFRGTIIRMRKGGNNANFTVRRTASHGIGVERTFLVRSPRIEKVEIQRRAKVRRAQLYFLRGRTGKRARLDEKREN